MKHIEDVQCTVHAFWLLSSKRSAILKKKWKVVSLLGQVKGFKCVSEGLSFSILFAEDINSISNVYGDQSSGNGTFWVNNGELSSALSLNLNWILLLKVCYLIQWKWIRRFEQNVFSCKTDSKTENLDRFKN